MSESEIYAELTKVFHDTFDDDDIVLKPDTSAADIDSWDSFNHINLVIAIESALHVRFSTANLVSMTTVGDMVSIIRQKSASCSTTHCV